MQFKSRLKFQVSSCSSPSASTELFIMRDHQSTQETFHHTAQLLAQKMFHKNEQTSSTVYQETTKHNSNKQ
jgi:hypothetical protein